MKYEIRNLFGTRKIILNEKEVKQYIKEQNKTNKEFLEYQIKTLPKLISGVILSGIIMSIILLIINIYMRQII